MSTYKRLHIIDGFIIIFLILVLCLLRTENKRLEEQVKTEYNKRLHEQALCITDLEKYQSIMDSASHKLGICNYIIENNDKENKNGFEK